MSKQTLSQTTKITTGIKLAPAQIQAARLIAIPAVALNDEIEKELENNPALDVDTSQNDSDDDIFPQDEEIGEEDSYDDIQPEIDAEAADDFYDASEDPNDDYDSRDVSDYELSRINRSKDDKVFERVPVAETSFQDSLTEQLAMFDISEEEREIAEYLIGSLNSQGYFEADSRTLADEIRVSYNLNISPERIEQIIKNVIQHLDPPGIGARNIKECLLIQLKTLSDKHPYSTARLLVEYFFEELSKKHYSTISKRTDLTDEQLNEVLQVIKSLNPYPGDGQSVQEKAANFITPDFIMTEEGGQLQLALNSGFTPKLKINDDYARQYRKMLIAKQEQKRVDRAQAEADRFVKSNVDKATEFINSLSIREQTLEATMRAIMARQEEFFKTGDETKLKPMILQDIADMTGYDKSTISRVTNDKYVQTYFGNIALKSLFSESVGDDDVSSKEIKNIIRQIVDGEDKRKPMNDDKLCALLAEKGYKIARRTIAKYRDELKIPVARLRKKL